MTLSLVRADNWDLGTRIMPSIGLTPASHENLANPSVSVRTLSLAVTSDLSQKTKDDRYYVPSLASSIINLKKGNDLQDCPCLCFGYAGGQPESFLLQ